MQTYDKFLENLDIILAALKIDFNQSSGRYFFPCPCHSSDNYNSCSIYTNTGIWRCFTRHCEYEYRDNLFGFVSGVLKCSYDEAKKFCENVIDGLDVSVDNPRPKPKQIDFRFKEISREKLLPFVDADIPFYLRRGYSTEILKKYDLFICKKKRNLLYGRIVFPIYNNDRTSIIGFVGRTLQPQCEKCRKFHSPTKKCPESSFEKIICEKWVNSKGLARNKLLFNYWWSRDYIRESGKIILVESQGDVLKIEMADIHNSVGIFGTELSPKQAELIKQSGAKQVILCMNNDEAGRIAADKIEKILGMETIKLELPENDMGDMAIPDIRHFLSTYLSPTPE